MSVKPHASPVLHAINYLLGELSAPQLETLRAFGGLQSYPRAKDPDTVDYSTGSVGIGATAPIWGRWPAAMPPGPDAEYSLVGDAELDEGACWEAILDPMVTDLGEVCWIVDLNRQSLDRIVPNIGVVRLAGMFEAAGWQMLTVKYGRLLHELFERPGGDALRRRIDDMENPEYQRLLRCTPDQLRERRGRRQARRARGGPRRPHPLRRHPQPRRPRPHIAARGVRRHRRHPPHRDLRLHRQGLRPGHRRPPAEPLVAAHRRAVGRSPNTSARRPSSRGRASPRPRPPPRCAATRPNACAARPSAALRCRPAHRHRPHPGRARHHAGRARPHPARPHAHRAGRREAHRHPRSGRVVVDEPGRLGQQGRRVVGARARGLVRRRPRDHPALARTPRRPAPGAGHRRDQPGRPPRRAGRHLEPVGRAAAAHRGALRPVRRTRAGAVVVRDLRGRPVDPGRHPVRGDARAGGRRPPVDHHAVGRAGAARLHDVRARVRHRRRVDAARRAGPARAPRRPIGLPAPLDPSGRPDPGRGARGPGRPGTAAAPGRRGRLPPAPRRRPGPR